MSSASGVFSFRNRWFTTSVVTTGAIAVVAALVGFIWLPLLQPGAQFRGIWDAICSAAGVLTVAPAGPVVQPDYQITRVVLTPRMLRATSAESIGRGATLALRCTMCHGARGLSQAGTPNLAGQYRSVVYKQLQDFKSGARASVVMAPLVAGLSDQDMLDLAAYYAYLPRVRATHASEPTPALLLRGAPARGIAPCGACHGELDNKMGSPWLEGQPASYLRAQLEDFAKGTRHNDINEQMRNVARQMSPAEIEAAASYYANAQ